MHTHHKAALLRESGPKLNALGAVLAGFANEHPAWPLDELRELLEDELRVAYRASYSPPAAPGLLEQVAAAQARALDELTSILVALTGKAGDDNATIGELADATRAIEQRNHELGDALVQISNKVALLELANRFPGERAA